MVGACAVDRAVTPAAEFLAVAEGRAHHFGDTVGTRGGQVVPRDAIAYRAYESGDERLRLSCACRRLRRVGWCPAVSEPPVLHSRSGQHLVFGQGKLAVGRLVPCMSHGVYICRRVARLVCVALCAVGLVATAAGGAAPAASGQAEQVVVFVSDRDGDSDIYGVNLDGTGLTQLTHNDVDDWSPVPSPDGRLIAFYGPTGFA